MLRHEPPLGAIVELYDLVADPGETDDLAPAHPDVVAELMIDVDEVRRRCGDAHTGTPGRDRRPVGVVADPCPLASHDLDHPFLVALYDGATG